MLDIVLTSGIGWVDGEAQVCDMRLPSRGAGCDHQRWETESFILFIVLAALCSGMGKRLDFREVETVRMGDEMAATSRRGAGWHSLQRRQNRQSWVSRGECRTVADNEE